MKTKTINIYSFDEIKKILDKGGVIAIPTETVYGLAFKIDNVKAYKKMLDIKGRDFNKPCTIFVKNTDVLKDYCMIDSDELRIVNTLMPGEITCVFKSKVLEPRYVVTKENTIGIRIPNKQFLLELLEYLDYPLVVTSVNRSGSQPINNRKDILSEFKNELDAIVVDDFNLVNSNNESELSSSNTPSTVVSFQNHSFKILREGAISKFKIETIFNRTKQISKIYIGCDHGGYLTKNMVIEHLKEEGYSVEDVGCYSTDSCDYPDFAIKVGEKVASDAKSLGIVICTSGEGVSIAANKVKNIRCGVCYNEEVSAKIVEHNNCNVAAFGAKYFSNKQILKMVNIFLTSVFEGGRHQRRVDKIDNYGR